MSSSKRPANPQHEPVTSVRQIAAGDYLTWTCGVCALCVQGGRRGLDLHMKTVHPEEQR